MNVLDKVLTIVQDALLEYRPEMRAAIDAAIDNFGDKEVVLRGFSPETFGQHEAIDRIWILAENVQSYILDHPSVSLDEEAYALVYVAHQLLLEAYQKLACAEKEDENSTTIEVEESSPQGEPQLIRNLLSDEKKEAFDNFVKNFKENQDNT